MFCATPFKKLFMCSFTVPPVPQPLPKLDGLTFKAVFTNGEERTVVCDWHSGKSCFIYRCQNEPWSIHADGADAEIIGWTHLQ